MKKKILFRCLIGAPLGLAISTIITICISFAQGDGSRASSSLLAFLWRGMGRCFSDLGGRRLEPSENDSHASDHLLSRNISHRIFHALDGAQFFWHHPVFWDFPCSLRFNLDCAILINEKKD